MKGRIMKNHINLMTIFVIVWNSVTLAATLKVPCEYTTIQQAIDASVDGDRIEVGAGLYIGEVNFQGKAITIAGIPDKTGAPIISNPYDFAVSCFHGESADSVLKNFVIQNSFMGVFIAGCSPTLQNLTIVNNKYGIEAYADAAPDIRSCIFWNNTSSHIFGCDAWYSWIPGLVSVSLDDGLIDYWGFDQIEDGKAVDTAGGHHGVINGAHIAPGIIGQGLLFDGVDDFVDCGMVDASIMMGDLSFCAWIKAEGDDVVIAIEGSPQDHGTREDNAIFFIRIIYRDNNYVLRYAHEYATGNNEQHDFLPLPRGVWQHVAVVRDVSEKSIHIYYNGEFSATSYYTNQPENPSELLHLTLGSRSTGINNYHGLIDEVALYQRVLSSQEIQDLVTNDNPLFVDLENGDYHLQSERGRHWPKYDIWVLDDITSPCIDGGDPNTDFSNERTPNGNRINMGVYGGTPFAGMSE